VCVQVEVGVFTSNGGWSLAVLHPRRLVVYTLAAVGTEQQTAYFSLHKNYEHRMDRTVCNMVYGAFGYNNRAFPALARRSPHATHSAVPLNGSGPRDRCVCGHRQVWTTCACSRWMAS
jgi:hypothetical protein